MAYLTLQYFGFSGHETFPLRYGWLKKGIDAVRQDCGAFSAPDAIVALGVGKNMVRSISHWCEVSGMICRVEDSAGRGKRFGATPLADLVFGPSGFDPYMEHQATLWLVHWQIASNYRMATTWYYVFSHLNQPEFTKDEIMRMLTRAMETPVRKAPRVSRNTIGRDVDCFIRTYVARTSQSGVSMEDSLECPLSELDLIVQGDDPRFYRVNEAYHVGLPDHLFAYAVADYRNRHFTERTILTLEQLAYQPGSPGRIFRLSPRSIIERLERIRDCSDGAISYSDSAGIRQVFIDKNVDELGFLGDYYRRGCER
jgi:hypothetical protein